MSVIKKAEETIIVSSIRAGLIKIIPILMIGAFALVLKSLPLGFYQTFIHGFAGGFIYDLLELVFSATFGALSIYMTLSVSKAYLNIKASDTVPVTGAMLTSLICFFIFAGIKLPGFGINDLGPKAMFIAIFSGLGGTCLFAKLYGKYRSKHILMSRGADRDFNKAISMILPVLLTVMIFALADMLITKCFNVDSIKELLSMVLNSFFMIKAPNFIKGLMFVILSSLLWFFGIHGSDVLEEAMQNTFASGLEMNQIALIAGAEPTHILTKQFFDCFVLMGGCGTTICLLIAILLFSKNHSRKELGWTASIPMLFNINELMIFGLPIIFNPVMLIPFLATPAVCYCTAYLAISTGLVPMTTGNIEWTTPVILGGYFATGSPAGSILQLFNIILGTFIYLPFVRMLDQQEMQASQKRYLDFVDYFKAHETEFIKRKLNNQKNVYGEFAKELIADIHHDIPSKIKLHYQPQYSYDGKCKGVEALLRWEHPVYGMLYPPMVIKLADDGEFLTELEKAIMLKVLQDKSRIEKKYGNIKISLNITGKTIITDEFIQFCRTQQPLSDICIEITEQTAISFNETTIAKLNSLKDMGLTLAIDDFSMGYTSINYLKNDLFSIIKLDGSLVQGLMGNQNCKEIISSITQLAKSLNMIVVAEYVETEKQKDILHKIGCDYYQGWLYAPAAPL